MRRYFHMSILVLASGLGACGGSSSGGGSSQSAPPSDVAQTSMVTKSAFSSSDVCPDGGITINQGIDSNSDGVLDAAEIFETQQVCNGAVGSPGVDSLVRVDEVAAGAICVYGGLRVSVGLDASDDGVLDAAEITQSSYVCSLVASQINGFSTLMNLADEPAGANCSAGGQKITTGLDTDRDAFLDQNEVIQLKYVCDGVSPVVYQVLAKTESEPAGLNCENGGLRLLTGLDVNQNTALDAPEVAATSYICNGLNASGITSLIRINNESIGTNCATGGKKILTGLDSDSNGVLADTEVANTAYLCNGQDGADGIGASTEPTEYISVTDRFASTVDLTCSSSAGYESRSVTNYYTLTEGAGGTPYKTCLTETCSEAIFHGSRLQYLGSGGCYDTSYTSINCNLGYQWDGSECAALPPAPPECSAERPDLCLTQQTCEAGSGFWYASQCNAECPVGEVETSRGCELPVASCSVYQQLADNICQDVDYVDLTGNLCGNYADPVKVTAGQHFVTCNTTFSNRLFVEPGAVLQVDREWDVIARSGVKINGSNLNPVVIETSANNLDGGWRNLELFGDASLNYETDEFAGDFVRYLDVSGYAGTMRLTGLSMENSTLSGDGSVYLYGSLIRGSTIQSGTNTWLYGSLLGSSDASAAGHLYAYGGLIYDTTLPNVSIGTASAYNSGALGLTSSAYFFNPVVNFSCSSNWAVIHGNAVVNGGSANSDCDVSDTGSPISTKYAAYILGARERSVLLGQLVRSEAYILNSSGIVQPAEVVWKARYDIDGVYYDSGQTWTGRRVDMMLPQREAYEVYVYSINGQTDLLGSKSIIVEVR